MAALADPALAVEGFDLEADHATLHRNHPRGGSHRRPDRRGGQMADVDLGTDRDPTWLQVTEMASPAAISISKIIIGVA